MSPYDPAKALSDICGYPFLKYLGQEPGYLWQKSERPEWSNKTYFRHVTMTTRCPQKHGPTIMSEVVTWLVRKELKRRKKYRHFTM